MIELIKMLNGMYSTEACIKFNFVDREVNRTRGNVVNSSYRKILVSFPIKYILGLTNFNCGSPAWS